MRFFVACTALIVIVVSSHLPADQITPANAPPVVGRVELDGDRLLVNANDQRTPFDWASVQSIQFDTRRDGSRGLRGEYFNDPDLKELARVRLDRKIGFEWGWNKPPEPFLSKTFSARWTGRLKPATSERYTMQLVSDDGSRLWIDDKLLIDRWNSGKGEQTAEIALEAGREVSIRVEYRNTGDGARMFLFWWSPTISRELVPAYRLIAPPVPQPIADDPSLERSADILVRSDGGGGQTQLESTTFTFAERSALMDRLPKSSRFITIRGLLRAKFSEPHLISCGGDGAVSMSVNGKAILDSPRERQGNSVGRVDLRAGELTPFEIQFIAREDLTPRFVATWFSQSMGSETLERSTYRDPAAIRMSQQTGGWSATVFSDLTFSRVDSETQFVGHRQQWNSPPGLPGDQFAVRVVGRLQVPKAGEYRFRVAHDDGCKFMLDGQQIFSATQFGEGTSKPIKLEPGREYAVQIDVLNSGGGPAGLGLRWATDDRKYDDLPATAQLPPKQTNAAPVIVLRQPVNDSIATTGRVPIHVQLDPPNAGDKIELLGLDRVLAESPIDKPSFEWINPPAGAHELQVRVVKDGRPVALSSRVVVHVGTPLKQLAGWTLYPGIINANDVEVGASAAPLVLKARRTALMDNTDRVPMVLQQIEGDFELSAEIASTKFDGPGSSVGLMVRPSLVQRGRSVVLGLSADGDPFTASRLRRGEDVVIQGARLAAGAKFLRIRREGNQLTLSTASQPGEWVMVDTRQIEADGPCFAGAFVVGTTDQFSEATLRDLSLKRIDSARRDPVTGLLLRDGRLLAGRVRRTDDQGRFRVERASGEEAVELDRVAALLIDSEDTPPATLPGVTLRSGDSFDGVYSGLRDERLFINSTLFGPADYSIKDVAAIWFAAVDSRGQFTVTLTDGSRYPADRIAGKGDRVELHRDGAKPTELPLDQVERIDRMKPSPD